MIFKTGLYKVSQKKEKVKSNLRCFRRDFLFFLKICRTAARPSGKIRQILAKLALCGYNVHRMKYFD